MLIRIAPDVLEGYLVERRRQLAGALMEREQPGMFDLVHALHLLHEQQGIGRTRSDRARCASAASSAAINPRYSATLLVATPMGSWSSRMSRSTCTLAARSRDSACRAWEHRALDSLDQKPEGDSRRGPRRAHFLTTRLLSLRGPGAEDGWTLVAREIAVEATRLLSSRWWTGSDQSRASILLVAYRWPITWEGRERGIQERVPLSPSLKSRSSSSAQASTNWLTVARTWVASSGVISEKSA